MLPPVNGLITLLTDFGHSDPYVGLMHGMIKREHKQAEVVDLCHGVPHQSVAIAGLFLAAAVQRFPAGTIHVAVVDPGVGTGRRIVAIVAHDCYWLAPDNGLLTPLFITAESVREVRVEALDLLKPGRTFHGRDVFAPVAGMLSGRRYGFSSLGPVLHDPVRMAGLADGGQRVVHVDHFGNLITNVSGSELTGASAVEIGGQRVQVRETYGAASTGELLALVNSFDLVEIAVCQGNARRVLGAGVGAPVAIANGSKRTA